MAKAIEDNDVAKEFLENLANSNPIDDAAKADFLALFGVPPYATLAAASAALGHNVGFFNTTTNRIQMTV